MSQFDPEVVEVNRPDGTHRVEVTYDMSGIIDAETVAMAVDGEDFVDVTPRAFVLTAQEEAYFADKFTTRLAEDAADRCAEMRGEKWG